MIRLEGYRTVWSLACKHVKNPKLRVVLTFQSLLVGGNPFATTPVYCLIAFLERRWGVHFPIGGMGALVSGLVGLIEGQGGSVQYSCGVAQISVEHGLAGNGVARARAAGARLESGERVAPDVVVSNAASAWTYKHLLAPEHRKRRMVMGARSPAALARACDLGVAMQLSNIARDVGEDARAGRVYLPLAWLREAGVDVEAWLAAPAFDARIAAVVQRVLAEAERLYAGVDSSVASLPASCRVGINAARSSRYGLRAAGMPAPKRWPAHAAAS